MPLHSAVVSFLRRIPYIGIVDTEHRRLLDIITIPIATYVLTPNAYTRRLGRKHIRYRANHEMIYLHPNRYNSDSSMILFAKEQTSKKIIVIRKIAWNAFHDFGKSGIDYLDLEIIISTFERIGFKIIISSEDTLPNKYIKYKMSLDVSKFHELLRIADLVISEGSTTASEAVCLGTPAVYINPLYPGIIRDLEERKLLLHLSKFSRSSMNSILSFFNDKEFSDNHSQYIAQSVDACSFICSFINNYSNRSINS